MYEQQLRNIAMTKLLIFLFDGSPNQCAFFRYYSSLLRSCLACTH